MNLDGINGNIVVSYGYDTSKHSYNNIKYKEVPFKDYLKDTLVEGIPNFNAQPSMDGLINKVAVEYKDNIELRNRLIGTIEAIPNKRSASTFIDEFSNNLANYYYGRNLNPSLIVPLNQSDSYTSNKLSSKELQSIDFNDFVPKMIANLSQLTNNITESTTNEYLQDLLDSYMVFKNSSTKKEISIYA